MYIDNSGGRWSVHMKWEGHELSILSFSPGLLGADHIAICNTNSVSNANLYLYNNNWFGGQYFPYWPTSQFLLYLLNGDNFFLVL